MVTRKAVIYAGKAFQELTPEEVVACAEHFHKAHVETTAHNAKLLRRTEKMEIVFTKSQLAQLDWWLSVHPNDDARYPDWTMFELTGHGYQVKRST